MQDILRTAVSLGLGVLLSAKEKKMRFIWTFMHFLDWWMKREEQFEYYAKN